MQSSPRSFDRLSRTIPAVGVAGMLVSLVAMSTPLTAATTTYTSAWGGGTINAGDTALLNNGATVTGNVIDNGTLQFNQTGTLTITSTISGTGTLSLTNTGTLTLSGTTAMPGIFGGTVVLDMTVNATQGRLKTANTGGSLGLVLGNSGTGTMNVNGGVAQIGNNFYLGYAAGGRGVMNLSSGTLSAYNLLVGGSGAGELNFSGGSMGSPGGRLTVAETNSGTFTMTGGTASGFNVTIGAIAGSVGTATISSGSWNTGNSLIVGGSGAGTLTVNGGAFTSSNGSIGRYAGSVSTATVTGGTWAESASLTVGGTGTGTLNVAGGVLTVGGTLRTGTTGSLAISSGTLQVGATTLRSNTFSGATSIASGVITIGAGGTSGSVTGDFTNTRLIFNRSDNSTYSGAISGTGSLVNQGTGGLTLAGANSYSGLTTISGGRISLSGSGSIGTGGLNLGTTGTQGQLDISAVTGGTYSLPATGNLTGVGFISGFSKTLAVLGSLAPGNSAGTITVGAGVTLDLTNSGSSVFEITDPAFTAGTYDLVSGNGSVVFGGPLNLIFTGGTYANGSDVLQLFANAGGRSGNFSSVTFTGLGVNQSATFNPVTGYVSLVPEPSTCVMALAGLACGGLSRWRRKRA